MDNWKHILKFQFLPQINNDYNNNCFPCDVNIIKSFHVFLHFKYALQSGHAIFSSFSRVPKFNWGKIYGLIFRGI